MTQHAWQGIGHSILCHKQGQRRIKNWERRLPILWYMSRKNSFYQGILNPGASRWGNAGKSFIHQAAAHSARANENCFKYRMTYTGPFVFPAQSIGVPCHFWQWMPLGDASKWSISPENPGCNKTHVPPSMFLIPASLWYMLQSSISPESIHSKFTKAQSNETILTEFKFLSPLGGWICMNLWALENDASVRWSWKAAPPLQGGKPNSTFQDTFTFFLIQNSKSFHVRLPAYMMSRQQYMHQHPSSGNALGSHISGQSIYITRRFLTSTEVILLDCDCARSYIPGIWGRIWATGCLMGHIRLHRSPVMGSFSEHRVYSFEWPLLPEDHASLNGLSSEAVIPHAMLSGIATQHGERLTIA